MTDDIHKYSQAETEFVHKLKSLVQKTIEEEKLILDNLVHPPKEVLTRGQKLADKVAHFGGSWAFIVSFFIVLVFWILFNTLAPRRDDFDPYPFILMNLVLSCIAALQAPIIMMSQNRKDEKDRKRSENDYLINLKSELEIRSLHEKLDLLYHEQIKTLYEMQLKQLSILNNIEQHLGEKKNSGE